MYFLLKLGSFIESEGIKGKIGNLSDSVHICIRRVEVVYCYNFHLHYFLYEYYPQIFLFTLLFMQLKMYILLTSQKQPHTFLIPLFFICQTAFFILLFSFLFVNEFVTTTVPVLQNFDVQPYHLQSIRVLIQI